MTINRAWDILLVACIIMFSSCKEADAGDTAQKENNNQLMQTTVYSESVQQNMQDIEFSEDEEANDFPDVDITNPRIDDSLEFGEKYGIWLSTRLWKYFGYPAINSWKTDPEDKFIDNDRGVIYSLCVGTRSDNTEPVWEENGVAISFDSGKRYIIEKLNLTEQCFNSLCKNAPTCYLEKDGKLYVAESFGGQVGWDYSYIVDYEAGNDSITYHCTRICEKESGYDDRPFTFTLKYSDEKWLLDDCSYVEGFCDDFCQPRFEYGS